VSKGSAAQVAATVVVAVLLTLGWPGWYLPARWFLAPVLVVLCAIDLRERILPDRILLPSIVVALALLAVGAAAEGEPGRILAALAGAALYAAILLVLHLVSPAGLGFGDVKLGLLLGLYLGVVGIGQVVWALLLGSFLGLLIAVPVAVRARDRRAAIPFGPALAAGTVLTLAVNGLIGG
jgi:leader peptidase (prepilin peptidase)/N-methyltransferase